MLKIINRIQNSEYVSTVDKSDTGLIKTVFVITKIPLQLTK